MNLRLAAVLLGLVLAAGSAPGPVTAAEVVEIRDYQGQKLDLFDRKYDNSIKGPQKIDPQAYRLKLDGLVAESLELKYDQVLALPKVRKVVIMHCVEGWSERLLLDGVRLKDLLDLARPKPEAKVVIFWAQDGYSSALPLDYVLGRDLMLASHVNGLQLDERRGFPFWLVAEDKLGYKWVRWVTRIQLSDKPYLGFWEKRGYSDQADAPQGRR